MILGMEEIAWSQYRSLSIKDCFHKEYRHLLLLSYWPLYLLAFVVLERVYPADRYIPVSSFLDSYIPFCEYFIIPYLLWFPFWIGLLVYMLRYEIPSFKRFMWYLILCLTVTLTIYFLYPTCQNLRPAEFNREGLFIWIVRCLYFIDTNTNTCPSAHIIVAVGAIICIWHSRTLSKPIVALPLTILGISICTSVVLVKQHSVIDIFTALPICALGYGCCYCLPQEKTTLKKDKGSVYK